jgi:hypothetical protein
MSRATGSQPTDWYPRPLSAMAELQAQDCFPRSKAILYDATLFAALSSGPLFRSVIQRVVQSTLSMGYETPSIATELGTIL